MAIQFGRPLTHHVYARAIGWGLAVLALAILVGCSESDRPLETPVRLEGEIFGTFYQVTIADPLTQGQAQTLEEGFLQELEDVDQAMSTYRDDAELVLFNQAPLNEWQPLSDELIEVMAIARSVAEASNGAFDVTIGDVVNLWSFGPEARPQEVPDESQLQERLSLIGFDALELDTQALQARRTRDVFVDLSGVAKGHATDRVAEYLERQDIEHYLVNLGGELRVKGYREQDSQEPWRIGIEVPENGPQRAQHVLPVHDISVATSGDYRNYFEEDGRRYSHTLDPRSGRPIEHHVASVSVAHPSNAWADAWATALSVLGGEAGMALAIEQELKVLMLVRRDDQWVSLASPAFVEFFGAETMEQLGIQRYDTDQHDA
ncbi:FAD:protein FMN transferase [Halomonas sp. Bachu 37]|uniref:FAD:protein FMN transferase n=1 Tax=Halomonas kashgarensis TaxID=3084920 RepID=UPI0032174BFA